MKHVFKTIRLNKEIPLPFQKRETDAGYDLYAAEDRWIFPLVTKRTQSNHFIQIEDGLFGLIQPRSGIREKGLFIDGVIDEGYQGNWGIVVTNISWLPRKIKKGERICQVIFLEPKKIGFDEQDEFLEKTDRGTKGFNSSGLK